MKANDLLTLVPKIFWLLTSCCSFSFMSRCCSLFESSLPQSSLFCNATSESVYVFCAAWELESKGICSQSCCLYTRRNSQKTSFVTLHRYFALCELAMCSNARPNIPAKLKMGQVTQRAHLKKVSIYTDNPFFALLRRKAQESIDCWQLTCSCPRAASARTRLQ